MGHTRKPWRHEPSNRSGYANPEFPDAYCGTIMGDDNMVLAVVIDDKVPGKANARLIAATPDLLEACEALEKALSDHILGSTDPFIHLGELENADRLARRAIVKATGI